MTCDEESQGIEQQIDQKTKVEIMEVLRKMFGNAYDIPKPEEILYPDGSSNKFYRSSY